MVALLLILMLILLADYHQDHNLVPNESNTKEASDAVIDAAAAARFAQDYVKELDTEKKGVSESQEKVKMDGEGAVRLISTTSMVIPATTATVATVVTTNVPLITGAPS